MRELWWCYLTSIMWWGNNTNLDSFMRECECCGHIAGKLFPEFPPLCTPEPPRDGSGSPHTRRRRKKRWWFWSWKETPSPYRFPCCWKSYSILNCRKIKCGTPEKRKIFLVHRRENLQRKQTYSSLFSHLMQRQCSIVLIHEIRWVFFQFMNMIFIDEKFILFFRKPSCFFCCFST